MPKSRSSRSFGVTGATSMETSGMLSPLWLFSGPPARTTVSISVSLVAVTNSSMIPSLR